jgi:Na+-transporting NADH:ubiquinone oxidoreductase subunit A
MTTVSPRFCACKPTDFTGVFPKLMVQEGETVRAGTPLYHDKNRNRILFTSPVSGIVKEIRRGERRVLQEIVIECDHTGQAVEFGKSDPDSHSREEVTQKLLDSGIWPFIRQRPFSVIANPGDSPKAIFISAFDTGPLAPDFGLMVEGEGEAFQAGVNALRRLTDGKVHLNVAEGSGTSKIFLDCKGVQINRFSGPHPAGDISVQVSRLDPLAKGDVIWYLRPQEVLTIGRLFLKGVYDATRIFAVTGSVVKKTGYFKSFAGSSIHEMVDGNVAAGNARYISGNVLTGTRITADGFAGFYDSQITLIPEGDYHEFFGWAMPGFEKYSFYNLFLSRLFPRRDYRLDTNLHGSERAFVMTGKYEQVFPFDIYPMQLLKAILAEDIDLMENLGIYEVDAEDFALIEFIDTSKIEIQSIVRKGLELVRKETM